MRKKVTNIAIKKEMQTLVDLWLARPDNQVVWRDDDDEAERPPVLLKTVKPKLTNLYKLYKNKELTAEVLFSGIAGLLPFAFFIPGLGYASLGDYLHHKGYRVELHANSSTA